MDKQTKEEKIKKILHDMEVLDRYYENGDLDIAVGRILNSLTDEDKCLDCGEQRIWICACDNHLIDKGNQ